jgi:hypothetical protein
LEVTNGWTKIALERLTEGRTHTLEIYAGSPIRSSNLDEADVRTNRKGLFSCGRVRSLLTIKFRPFSNLLAIKQVNL